MLWFFSQTLPSVSVIGSSECIAQFYVLLFDLEIRFCSEKLNFVHLNLFNLFTKCDKARSIVCNKIFFNTKLIFI